MAERFLSTFSAAAMGAMQACQAAVVPNPGGTQVVTNSTTATATYVTSPVNTPVPTTISVCGCYQDSFNIDIDSGYDVPVDVFTTTTRTTQFYQIAGRPVMAPAPTSVPKSATVGSLASPAFGGDAESRTTRSGATAYEWRKAANEIDEFRVMRFE